MKILIGQPKLERGVKQLSEEIVRNPQVDMVIYPEGYLNQNVEQACMLASTYNTMIISGYKKPKDRAIIINRLGEVVLDRAKYDSFKVVEEGKWRIGHLLCDELVLQGLGEISELNIDFVAHPIGVGMFSDQQFNEWITEAITIAKRHMTMVIGTSHADGCFKDSDISIPIAYCVDLNGEVVFVMKNDTRTVIFDTESREIEVLQAIAAL